MSLTVKRYGGHMPLKAKEKTFSLDGIDPAARKALGDLRQTADNAAKTPPMPDGYTYTFEFEDGGSKQKFEVPGRSVPDALRKLLP